MLRMLFPIYSIHPNPWQPRATEDTEHIEALAASILADGLLQEPVGRLCDASGEPKSVREVMTRINDPSSIVFNVQKPDMTSETILSTDPRVIHSATGVFALTIDLDMLGFWAINTQSTDPTESITEYVYCDSRF